MNLTPNEEQSAIIDAALASKTNMMVKALAGAAKTTTLVMIAEALPAKTNGLCISFNKDVQTEMQARLPRNIECKTINALGHRIWGSFLRMKLELDKSKMRTEVIKLVNTLDADERDDFYEEEYEGLMNMIRMAKVNGYVPAGTGGYWKSKITIDELSNALEFAPTGQQIAFLDRAMKQSLVLAQRGVIDFDDQIMLPCIAPVTFPVYDLIMVDEAQDLSSLNHFIIKKIVRNKRLIAVGDPFQAIYAFRGADTQSMDNMAKLFDPEYFKLTVNYRCAENILEHVRWRAPEIQARPDAPDGVVHYMESWSEENIKDEAAIICRNNAPLFRMAIRLIAEGRKPEIRGRDMIATIKKTMKKLGKPGIKQAQAIENLNKWKAKQLERARNKGYIKDQYKCIMLFLERNVNLGDAIEELNHLATQGGRITLTTGHKAKGLEFDTVYILDHEAINMEEEQDRNLAYVMATRAKKELFYIDSKGYIE